MTPFVMVGAAGRMGRAIIALSENKSEEFSLKLVGAIESAGSKYIGIDAGDLAGSGPLHVPVTSDLEKVIKEAHVVIDFSSPESTLISAKVCAANGAALVIGTTGLSEQQKESVLAYKSVIPVMISPNMSVGVNLLFHLTEIAADQLGSGYDVEVVEAHHKFKKDAPSGTALRLKDILLRTLKRKESDVIYGRSGITGERPPNEVCINTIRGGDIAGEHTVYFITGGERIELTHRASSRDTFALGALRAASYMARVGIPGEYTMKDILAK